MSLNPFLSSSRTFGGVIRVSSIGVMSSANSEFYFFLSSLEALFLSPV